MKTTISLKNSWVRVVEMNAEILSSYYFIEDYYLENTLTGEKILAQDWHKIKVEIINKANHRLAEEKRKSFVKQEEPSDFTKNLWQKEFNQKFLSGSPIFENPTIYQLDYINLIDIINYHTSKIIPRIEYIEENFNSNYYFTKEEYFKSLEPTSELLRMKEFYDNLPPTDTIKIILTNDEEITIKTQDFKNQVHTNEITYWYCSKTDKEKVEKLLKANNEQTVTTFNVKYIKDIKSRGKSILLGKGV